MKKFPLIFFAWMFLTGFCFAAEKAAVTIILSSDAEPYLKAEQGFKEFCDKQQIKLRTSEYVIKTESAEEICSRINSERPDIIFVLGTKALQSVQKIRNIPVIFSLVLNPQIKQGSNITGVYMDVPVLLKLQEIKNILPNVKKIGLIYSSESSGYYEEAVNACKQEGLELLMKKIDVDKEFPVALDDISAGMDCFLMVPDSKLYFQESIKYLLSESLTKKFPVIGLSYFYTNAGALISFDCDYSDIGRQAGVAAVKILKGVKPGNIPSVQPEKIQFSVNVSVAERLDIKISQEILAKAGEVYGK